MANRNAIARRLDRLNDQWNEFAQYPEARLLRWIVRDDEYRMIEAFIQTEQDDAAGEIPDLFLRFTEPFQDVNQYGSALREGLIAQHAVARDELEGEDDVDMSWEPPAADGRHSLIAFIEACTTLQAHHAESMEKLALILTPVTVADDAEWLRWLRAFAEHLPDTVRAAVVDSAEAPVLEALAKELPERVRSVPADLAMPAAIAELARSAGTSGPDGQFRTLFAMLGQALGKGDMDGARRSADGALAVAQENGWTHLVAAVHAALAGGLLGAGLHAEAIRSYGAADRAGAELASSGDPTGAKLRLQAGLGACAAMVAAGDHAAAALAYGATAAQARRCEDKLMLLECWRMAAWCHEQNGDTAQAWECGLKALDAGEQLEPPDRAGSTLAYAGDGLLRIAAHSPEHIGIVENWMMTLLGADWRASLTATPAFT